MIKFKALFIAYSIFACLIFTSCLEKANHTNLKAPRKFGAFKFDKMKYNFGKIKDGDTVSHIFTFKNIGKYPLIIHDVSTGCGCTVAQCTKTPVLPNKGGIVKVQFSKHHDPGLHVKNIILKANTEDTYTILHIYAKI